MTETGPNDARRVVWALWGLWAIGVTKVCLFFFFFLSLFCILTNNFSYIRPSHLVFVINFNALIS